MMKNKREKGDGNMICSVRTLGISGIQGSAVTAECYISQGLPGFDIVGLPDAAVKEARDRVRAAAKSSGSALLKLNDDIVGLLFCVFILHEKGTPLPGTGVETCLFL